MKVYRCKGCGYLEVGLAPDICPMCGAPKKFFVEYEVPDVKGTKTEENLKAAFAGESQANRRYTLYQRIAELEGVDQEIIDAFDRPLKEETAHALAELIYLGGYGDTAENLKMAAEGEKYEKESMYPEFAATAEEEGFAEIAHFFRAVGNYEGEHMAGYKEAGEKLEG